MRIRKQNAARSQTIQIRCYRLWMTAHTADPIIEIIHRNE
jgi:hypothetical protein